jgi:F0F1-type ATP synthase membrane subunit c/vacuolar-type H+-ATPase subunit K
MRNLTIAMVMLLSTIGPSAVIAVVGFSAVKALGRNPSAAPKILTAMVTAFVFAEAIAVVALLIVYNIFK